MHDPYARAGANAGLCVLLLAVPFSREPLLNQEYRFSVPMIYLGWIATRNSACCFSDQCYANFV